jgi:hypothetical protein
VQASLNEVFEDSSVWDTVYVESVVTIVDNDHGFIGRQRDAPAIKCMGNEGKESPTNSHVCPDRQMVNHLFAVDIDYSVKAQRNAVT